jgi:hypothetical protein
VAKRLRSATRLRARAVVRNRSKPIAITCRRRDNICFSEGDYGLGGGVGGGLGVGANLGVGVGVTVAVTVAVAVGVAVEVAVAVAVGVAVAVAVGVGVGVAAGAARKIRDAACPVCLPARDLATDDLAVWSIRQLRDERRRARE